MKGVPLSGRSARSPRSGWRSGRAAGGSPQARFGVSQVAGV